MAAKKPQALKFTEGLEEDLKFIAKVKGITYNGLVESVLSTYVLVQKKAIKEIAEQKNGKHVIQEVSVVASDPSVESVKEEEWV